VERTRDVHSSVKYCTDAEKRTGRLWTIGFSIPEERLRLVPEDNLYGWQQDLLRELQGEPSPRTVIWYTDLIGGCGKTELCRRVLRTHRDSLYLSSAAGKDMLHQVVKSPYDPRIVLINLSRQAEGAFSYASVEAIKDGLCFSGKYEGGTRLFPTPHIVVFSNWHPDETKLSADRWDIRELLGNPPHVRN